MATNLDEKPSTEKESLTIQGEALPKQPKNTREELQNGWYQTCARKNCSQMAIVDREKGGNQIWHRCEKREKKKGD